MVSAAAPISEQSAVTDWPTRILLTLATLAVIALALYFLRLGWNRRRARQEWSWQLPGLRHAQPAAGAGQPAAGGRPGVAGKYLGTIESSDWTKRIVAAGGIARSWASVTDAGVLLERQGEPALLIPAGDLIELGTAPGFLLKAYGRNGVLTVGWRLNGHDVVTGLRYVSADDQGRVRAAIEDLMARRSDASVTGSSS